ncbi:MAG: helix-turn-helix domain-containing protein [Xenococcus sp. (in: cyanobacteria)]
MTRRQKDPLRPLTLDELQMLEQLSRSRREPAAHVVRSQLLLAVANGASYTEAARSVGRRSPDAVSKLVSRFNQVGLAALEPQHRGGAKLIYDSEKRQVILETLSQAPKLESDGSGHWSLSILQRHLRQQPEFSMVSTYTLWRVLHEGNWSWQAGRSWCQTGVVKRRRQSGIVEVTDPDSQAKKP